MTVHLAVLMSGTRGDESDELVLEESMQAKLRGGLVDEAGVLVLSFGEWGLLGVE